MGLEIRGGSSDFWATEGEPRNQSNRYFMSAHCMHWTAPGFPGATTSLSELSTRCSTGKGTFPSAERWGQMMTDGTNTFYVYKVHRERRKHSTQREQG